jgi:phage baseplate assembly protein V
VGARRIEFDGRQKQENGQQFLSGRAYYNDAYSDILHLQQHGFYSNPPPGSQGLLHYPNGNPDEAYILGIEHRDHQPSGINPGGTAIYDASGQILKFVSSGMVVDTASKTITITSGPWTVTAPTINLIGDVAITGNMTISGGITAGGSIVDGDGDGGA